MSETGRDPEALARTGIDAAKKEDYAMGLMVLAEAYNLLTKDKAKIPATTLSYYGVCLAHTGKTKEGIEFCQFAVGKDSFNAELYINLAKAYNAARSRRKAIEAVEKGLALDPRSAALQRMRVTLGVRKSPVIPFLGRDNPLNVSLGKVRQKIRSSAAKKKKA